MAKNTIADLDTTTSNNSDIFGQSTLGTADAKDLDAVDRSVLALLARFYSDLGGVVTVGGSANAITITSASTYQALESGLVVGFKAASANTGATTLNLDGLGAKAVRLKGDVALSAGEIAANGRYLMTYDAAYNSSAGAWVLMNPETQRLDDDLTAVAATGVSAFSGLLYGLTLSNNVSDATNDIDIAAGIAIDSTNAKFLKLASGITKRLDASWAVGTGNGGLDTGSIANTTYHMWLIMRSDTGVVDVLFSASASSPTMPANYDYKRRIGSIVRTGGAIKAFVQNGDTFWWSTPLNDLAANNPGTSAATRTLTLPTGIVVEAMVLHGILDVSTGVSSTGLLSALSTADVAPVSLGINDTQITNGGSSVDYSSSWRTVLTNTSAQIRSRISVSNSDITEFINTFGWIDQRGRLG